MPVSLTSDSDTDTTHLLLLNANQGIIRYCIRVCSLRHCYVYLGSDLVIKDDACVVGLAH